MFKTEKRASILTLLGHQYIRSRAANLVSLMRKGTKNLGNLKTRGNIWQFSEADLSIFDITNIIKKCVKKCLKHQTNCIEST